ncbi:hypothetical protein [Streptomyces sp. SID3343]|uniref:hypothetical protein n=1 Tax=Streptomyces sp. SID3343 TaxID=2690260 RepID=UPI0013712D38|nr:hypothetical protein [Streptomyces sp. SID3343]MYW01124.1 hypothetical protein [Streptomyces sp. SID3343]
MNTCSPRSPRTSSRSRRPPAPKWSSSGSPSTAEQVALYNLSTAPPKPTDRRSFSGTATTQAEALPPDILAAIVRQAIEARRDPAVHQRTLEREEIERQAVRERLGRG